MAILFIIIGVVLVFAAVNNKLSTLVSLLSEDWAPTEQNIPSFAIWAFVMLCVGALGYAKPLRPLSTALMALVIVVLALSNKGFFNNLLAAFQNRQLASSAGNSSQPASPISLANGNSLADVVQSFTPSLEGTPNISLPSSLTLPLTNAAQNLLPTG
jgi:hypothetical protein